MKKQFIKTIILLGAIVTLIILFSCWINSLIASTPTLFQYEILTITGAVSTPIFLIIYKRFVEKRKIKESEIKNIHKNLSSDIGRFWEKIYGLLGILGVIIAAIGITFFNHPVDISWTGFVGPIIFTELATFALIILFT